MIYDSPEDLKIHVQSSGVGSPVSGIGTPSATNGTPTGEKFSPLTKVTSQLGSLRVENPLSKD